MRPPHARGSMARVPETLQELGYVLARQALARQETMLEDLRTRTGTLLTATALVATFLGARALDGERGVLRLLLDNLWPLGEIIHCFNEKVPRGSSTPGLRYSSECHYSAENNMDKAVSAAEANRRFSELLREKRIPHEYRELPGDHSWQYWDRQLKEVLKIVAEKLRAASYRLRISHKKAQKAQTNY